MLKICICITGWYGSCFFLRYLRSLLSAIRFSFSKVNLCKIFIMAGGVLLVACRSNSYNPPPNTGKYAPEQNLHPSHYVTVLGHIDLQLKHSVQLKLIANYYTTHETCSWSIDQDNTESPRFIEDTFIVHPDAAGNYKQSIAIDNYSPGMCGWKLNYLAYQIPAQAQDESRYGIAYFADQGVAPQNLIGIDNWICEKNKACKIKGGVPLQADFEQTGSLSRNLNYVMNINFKAEGI